MEENVVHTRHLFGLDIHKVGNMETTVYRVIDRVPEKFNEVIVFHPNWTSPKYATLTEAGWEYRYLDGKEVLEEPTHWMLKVEFI